MLFIGIEGGIGVGKSTVLEAVKAHFTGKDVQFVDEPVDIWMKTGLLQAMYAKELDAGAFQHCALMTRIGRLMEVMASGPRVIIGERSPYSDGIFARLTLTGFGLTAYNLTYQEVMKILPRAETRFIRLKCGVPQMLQRISSRDRSAENAITKEYLLALEAAHDEYASEHTVININAEKPASSVAQEVIAEIERLVRDHGALDDDAAADE